MKNNIIIVNPKKIVKLSPISGCANSRKEKAKNLKCYWKNSYLYGDWDLDNRLLQESLTRKDYELFIKNQESVYNWKLLQDSVIKNGYIQNSNERYIEVAIGRTGELFLVDGRHRLFLAQKYNISEIPVEVLDIHPEYKFQNLQLIKNKVIPEFLYDMIVKKWNKDIGIYHHWGTINHRYKLVKEKIALLKNKNVLEIGCNSGMFMWSIMNYANKLIEVEKQKKYYEQCEQTLISLIDKHYDRVIAYNSSFKEYLKNKSTDKNFNALYASFILYHMNNEEIELLKSKVLSKCNVVIIPNRNKERRNLINNHYLNRPEAIRALLEASNFKVDIIYPDKGYSVIIGIKNDKN